VLPVASDDERCLNASVTLVGLFRVFFDHILTRVSMTSSTKKSQENRSPGGGEATSKAAASEKRIQNMDFFEAMVRRTLVGCTTSVLTHLELRAPSASTQVSPCEHVAQLWFREVAVRRQPLARPCDSR
jgi:hypothetical protein